MIFSNILENGDNTEIGLVALKVHPPLHIGVILATFNFDGNTPSCMHLLKMLNSTADMHSDDILINLMGIFSMPAAFFSFQHIIL